MGRVDQPSALPRERIIPSHPRIPFCSGRAPQKRRETPQEAAVLVAVCGSGCSWRKSFCICGMPLCRMVVAGTALELCRRSFKRGNFCFSCHFRSFSVVQGLNRKGRGDPEGSVPCRVLRLEGGGGGCQWGGVMGVVGLLLHRLHGYTLLDG